MSDIYKFGWKPEAPQPYKYSGIWSKEKTIGPERLVIAPPSDHIALMKELSTFMPEPFGFLYVLTVPRTQGEAGRYQSPEPIERLEAETFLERFKDFFERDGRHHLWMASASNDDLLVYDKHNIIYAYGHLSGFESVLHRRGIKQVEEVELPTPHFHNYNPALDNEEVEILRYWNWKFSPLQEADDG